ncbi:MAG: hypothetical protein SOW59_05250 [Corynebacterium sp.]|nr:hypothetical protein [Corynebacterium sp.]
MASLLLLISLAAAGGAAALWYAAVQQERRALQPARESETGTEQENTPSLENSAPESGERDAEAKDAHFSPVALSAEEAEDLEEVTEFDIEPEIAPEIQSRTEFATEATSLDSETASDLGQEPSEEPAGKPEQVSQAAPEPESEREIEHRTRNAKMLIPGAVRRERKAWAQDKNFEFIKSDSYLEEEWQRGAAAGGAQPRDIVAGSAFGHEMLLMDLGGIPVMAMRTGAASDVIVDFRREGELDTKQPSEDLVQTRHSHGFAVWANEPAVVQRMWDIRVDVALERMPADVDALWFESEWVLAQMDKHARSATWEDMLAPLALLADAARVLPPRPGIGQTLRLDGGDPTRLVPTPAVVELSGVPALAVVDDDFHNPPIQRPEEPLVMPTRAVEDTLGDFGESGASESVGLGDDEVEAIGVDGEASQSFGRMPRTLDKGASIFDDATRGDED